MNSKALFSPAGLVGIAVALIVSVVIISFLPSLRIDLTEDKLYTLSEGSRNIVSNLENPIELRFFYSESATEDQPQIRAYGTRVQELLEEIVIASDGNLSLSVIVPEPFSEDEDLATQFGIQAVPVSQGGQSIYFGLVVSDAVDEADLNPLAPRAVMSGSETEEDIERRLEEKERPPDSVPMEDILEAGRASVARRQQIAAEMEAMREALQRAIAKDEP